MLTAVVQTSQLYSATALTSTLHTILKELKKYQLSASYTMPQTHSRKIAVFHVHVSASEPKIENMLSAKQNLLETHGRTGLHTMERTP